VDERAERTHFMSITLLLLLYFSDTSNHTRQTTIIFHAPKLVFL